MIGSPVGLFCALRGVNPQSGRPLGSPAASELYPGSAPGGLPVCRRFYNVFHPFDPVAYRMEPLIVGSEVRRPQLVPYHRGGRRLHVGLAETGESVAKTMDRVTSALTFSFGRSRSQDAEQVRSPRCCVCAFVAVSTVSTQQVSGLCPSGRSACPLQEQAPQRVACACGSLGLCCGRRLCLMRQLVAVPKHKQDEQSKITGPGYSLWQCATLRRLSLCSLHLSCNQGEQHLQRTAEMEAATHTLIPQILGFAAHPDSPPLDRPTSPLAPTIPSVAQATAIAVEHPNDEAPVEEAGTVGKEAMEVDRAEEGPADDPLKRAVTGSGRRLHRLSSSCARHPLLRGTCDHCHAMQMLVCLFFFSVAERGSRYNRTLRASRQCILATHLNVCVMVLKPFRPSSQALQLTWQLCEVCLGARTIEPKFCGSVEQKLQR
jgi:hypothetical protein